MGFLCHPTYCVAGASVQQSRASIPAPHLVAGTTSVASRHRRASAKCNLFGDLVQVIDEALRYSWISACCE